MSKVIRCSEPKARKFYRCDGKEQIINSKKVNIMNYEITLTENIENPESIKLCVNKRTLNKIIDDQYKGGFLRFHIDFYSENKKRANARPLKDFYKKIFMN